MGEGIVRALSIGLLIAISVNQSAAQHHNPANGHYYLQVSGITDWFAAHAAAQNIVHGEIRGHLATITSQVELEFVQSKFSLAGNWIGGFQMPGAEEPVGGWRWITDEPWDFSAWNVGEPNNLGANEDGVQFTVSAELELWNDEPRYAPESGFIVEFPVGGDASPIPRGDFDGNAIVDVADLRVWQSSYGSSEFLAADADRNGTVNGRDFLNWQRDLTVTGEQISSVDVGQLKTLDSGTKVAVVGTLTSTVDLINASGSKSFYLQDATGGITVFAENDHINSLLLGKSEGDKVVVSGELSHFNGVLQLQPLSHSRMTRVGHDGVPEPVSIDTADLLDQSSVAESLENMFVEISDVRFTETGNFAGVRNYTVTDGTTTATVRVSTTSQDLVGAPIPTGSVNLAGLLSQFHQGSTTPGEPGTGYQLLLRSFADITPVGEFAATNIPEPSSTLLLVLGCGVLAMPLRSRSQ